MEFHPFTFIYTTLLFVGLYQSAIVMRFHGAGKAFARVKADYDLKKDPFNQLNIEQRTKMCDELIAAKVYIFAETEAEGLQSFSDVQIENYQKLVANNVKNKAIGNDDTPGIHYLFDLVNGEAVIANEKEKNFRTTINDLDSITVNNRKVMFGRFPCVISDNIQWYVASGSGKHAHFLLERTASHVPLTVVGVVDMSPETEGREVDMGFAIHVPKKPETHSISVCDLNPRQRYHVCTVAHETAGIEHTDTAQMIFNTTVNQEAKPSPELKDIMLWYDSSVQPSCKKREVSVKAVPDDISRVFTLACAFEEEPTKLQNMFVAVSSMEGNDKPTIILAPPPEKEKKTFQVKTSVKVDVSALT